MRGDVPVEFQVPVQGVVANVPVHQVGNQALINGDNCFVDIDGLLKTRLGYTPVAPQMAVTERVQGLISDLDSSGVIVQVSGGATTWQYFNGSEWINITGSPLTTDPNDFVRFIGFPQGTEEYIYGVNNSNGLKYWYLGLPAVVDVTVPFTFARDIESLANRVVVVNTTEGGVQYNQRVRWSSVNDGTTWPGLAFADLRDESDQIVGIKRTSRTSAVIYRSFSAWYMQAVPGDDASAFTFERIPAADSMVGPISTAGIVSAEGSHYYFGIDGRVYQYDGTSIYPISAAIDPLSLSQLNTGFGSRSWAVYLPSKRMLFFFFPGQGEEDPNIAIAYSLATGAFWPLFYYPEGISIGATVQSQVGPTWLNWVPLNSTWPEVPYPSWSSIPTANALGVWVGTVAGNVHSFFTANSDNGVIIPYTAQWGLVRVSPLKMLQTDFMEIYFMQAAEDEAIEADLIGYAQPYSTNITHLWSLAINLADDSTFFAKAEPGPANPANLKANLLSLVITSQGFAAQMIFGGSLVSSYSLLRGDYLAAGQQ